MKVLLFASLLLASTQLTIAQADSSSLLREIETKLNAGSTVSQILTGKEIYVHSSQTRFRDLIHKYSSDKVLTITADDEPGKKIKVLCTVKNEAGQAMADALVYLYQTDSRGWYAADAPHVQLNEGDMRHARLFGYVKTNNQGQFELRTVKPSGYPQSDLPAHIHVHVTASGYTAYVNEFLFDDDERLVGNVRTNAQRNNFMISKPEKAATPFQQQFSYTITLTKD